MLDRNNNLLLDGDELAAEALGTEKQ